MVIEMAFDGAGYVMRDVSEFLHIPADIGRHLAMHRTVWKEVVDRGERDRHLGARDLDDDVGPHALVMRDPVINLQPCAYGGFHIFRPLRDDIGPGQKEAGQVAGILVVWIRKELRNPGLSYLCGER